MRDPAFHMTMLYDFYGDLLTERQREFYDLYYNEDFSLAEIAENAGITRQGVRDVLVRAEAILTEMEDKTGIVARFLEVRRGLTDIEECAGRINALNAAELHSSQLETLVKELCEKAADLKE